MPLRRSALFALAVTLLATPALFAQRAFIADPMHAYLVEGDVREGRGAPVAGLLVERVQGAGDPRPFSQGAYREVTDARGHFRFAFRGFGLSTGRTWHLALRRPGCSDVIETVELAFTRMPDGNGEGDVRTGLVFRLAPCVAAAAPTAQR